MHEPRMVEVPNQQFHDESQQTNTSLKEIGAFIAQGIYVILLSGTLGIFGASIFCYSVKPRFTATSQMLLQPTDQSAVFFDNAHSNSSSETETGRIESQIQVMRSAEIAKKVILRQGLIEKDKIKAKDHAANSFSILSLFRNKDETSGGNDAGRTSPQDIELTINRFLNNLSVRRVGQSSVIEVQFTDEDPSNAAGTANEVLAAYIDAEVETKADNARRAGEWLASRLKELQEQVAQSRIALETFKATSDLQNAGERTVKFAQLESMAQTQSRLYDAFLQRSLEAVQKVTYPVPDARIIARASPPLIKSFPKVGLTLLLAFIVSCFLGACIYKIMVTLSPFVRSSKKLSALTNLPILATIPQSRNAKFVRFLPFYKISRYEASYGHGNFSRIEQVKLSRAIRRLSTALKQLIEERSSKSLAFISDDQEGSFFPVILTIAQRLSESNLSVLCVEICEHSSKIEQSLNYSAHGVELPLQIFSQPHGLVVMRRANNLAILSGDNKSIKELCMEGDYVQMEAFISNIGAQYEFVIYSFSAPKQIVNLPSVLKMADDYIVVVDCQRSKQNDVQSTLEDIQLLNIKIYGIIANNVVGGSVVQ